MRKLLVALSALLVLGTASAKADTDADFRSTVSKMEQAVFGGTQPAKPLVSRIKALEVEAFTKPQTGSIKHRIAGLQKTIGVTSQQFPPIAPGYDNAGVPAQPPQTLAALAGKVHVGSQKSSAKKTPKVDAKTAKTLVSEGVKTADAIPTAPSISKSADPTVVRARLLHGIKMHKEGNVEGAERIFREVLVTNPYDPDACFSLGSICESRGDLIGAVGYYRAATMSNPNDREAHEAVASIEEKMALQQGPFVNPLSGTPLLQARASEVSGAQPLNYQALQPQQLVLTPAPPINGYVHQRPQQIPTVGVTQNPPPRGQSTKAAVARAVATMAARQALQFTPLHCPLCNLIRF